MANEKRLIYANKVEKAVTDIYCGTAGYRARERLWQAVEAIKECTTVDAVEVVRCKDCIAENICTFSQFLGEDGFCSCGERKDDDTTTDKA